jgi:TRAP-type C4-dicarboxylate transport system permease small subunit
MEEPETPKPGTLEETIVERVCRLLCEIALVGMVMLICAEVVARLFGYSFQMSDELCGYLLSALTFLSLPVALAGGAYHQVEYFYGRLDRVGRLLADIAFALISLAFTLVLAWQLWRLVARSYASQVVAPTLLGTPLWLPQSMMLIGTAALAFTLMRVLLARGRALTSGKAAKEASHV